MAVESNLAWPSSTWITRMSTLRSSKWVAKECLLCLQRHRRHWTKPLRGSRVRRVFRNPELLLRFLGTPIARTWSSCKWQLVPTRKGVSNDATSAAYDRGHAGAEPIGEYTGVISSASLAVRVSF